MNEGDNFISYNMARLIYLPNRGENFGSGSFSNFVDLAKIFSNRVSGDMHLSGDLSV